MDARETPDIGVKNKVVRQPFDRLRIIYPLRASDFL